MFCDANLKILAPILYCCKTKKLSFSGTKVIGAKSMKEMVATLKKPRRVMMLVKAGPAVDAFIEQLVS